MKNNAVPKESYTPKALDYPSLKFDLGENAEMIRSGKLCPRISSQRCVGSVSN